VTRVLSLRLVVVGAGPRWLFLFLTGPKKKQVFSIDHQKIFAHLGTSFLQKCKGNKSLQSSIALLGKAYAKIVGSTKRY